MLNGHSERGDEKKTVDFQQELVPLLPGLLSGSLTALWCSPWVRAGGMSAGFCLSQPRATGAGLPQGLQEDVHRGQEESSGRRRRTQGKVPQQAGKQPGK